MGLIIAVGLSGCQDREPIRRYTVEKPPPIEPLASANPHAGLETAKPPSGEPTDATLGAIVPLEPRGWFFKLAGPVDAVAAHEKEFTALLESVQFTEDGEPSWKLPEGWHQRAGNQIRFATLEIPSEGKPLEVSVTALPNEGGDAEGYVLANVNRWRRQLSLPPVDAGALASESTQVKMGDATATVVNLVGHAAPDTMGRPPFFSGAPDGN